MGFLFLSAELSYAQADCVVRGVVRSGTQPLAGAVIEVLETGAKITTNADGSFYISQLPCKILSFVMSAPDHQILVLQLEASKNPPSVVWTLSPQKNILPTVVVATNKLENSPLHNTLNVQTADRAYLEAQSAVNFASSLEKKAGVNTIQTGVGIGKPVIRGLSFNRIQVNNQGIKQEGQQWGADHGLELDPFDVSGVEIVKGAASLIYGSDAMAGVINIVPQPLFQKDTLNIRYTALHHTNNQLIGNSLQVSGRKGAWWMSIRGSTQEFSDYRVNANQFTYAGFVLPIYEERLKNTAGQERHGSFRLGYLHKKIQSTLTISTFNQKAGLFTGAVGIPNRYNLQHNGDFNNVELPRQENAHHQIIWNNLIPLKNSYIEVDLGWQQNSRQEFSRPHAHGYPITFTDTLSLGLALQTLTGNVRWHKSLKSGWRQVLGLQAQHLQNNFSGFEFLIPQFQTTQFGAFVFFEKSWRKNWLFTGGARGDWAQHRIAQHKQPVFINGQFTGTEEIRNPDIFRNFGNMSGAVGAKWAATTAHVVKINFGSSFRIPTAIELSMNGVHHGNFRHEVGSESLTSERGYQWDVNYDWTYKSGKLSTSLFVNYFDQFIYLAPQPRFSPLAGAGALWQYQQNDAIFGGFELDWQQEITSWLVFQSTTDYVRNQNLNTGLPLPLTPPLITRNRITVQPTKAIKKLKTGFFVEWMAAAAQTRTDRNERATPSYQLWEAGLWAEISTYLKIYVTAQNLGDTPYFNHLSRYRLLNLPEPGRNLSIRLIANLGV